MELSLSDSQPFTSKWDESQCKCSGHCCSIDYQWKMSDSLSQVSLFHPITHTQTHTGTQLNYSLLLIQSLFIVEHITHKLWNVSNQQQVLYMAIASKPISNLQWKCFAARICWTYSIIHWTDIKFESLVGCLLKSWPRPPLIKLIHGFNKWGTGSRCACRCAHEAHRHPSPWSGIFSSSCMQRSHKTPADVAGLQPRLTQGKTVYICIYMHAHTNRGL